MLATLRSAIVTFGMLVLAAPASAQWTRVAELPGTELFSVFANGDTIAVGADSTVWVSTDGGASWRESAKLAAGVTVVRALCVRHGRLYAGTYGQGLFASSDLGLSWAPFSQGLVGGIANSQLYTADLLARGDSLFLATSGAGAWVRNLAAPGTWSHFGNAFEPNQASNMNGIASGGTRLLAASGANGTVFFRDAGASDWTRSWLDNTGIVPGLSALAAAWTGGAWVVGTNIGLFRSAQGQEPWTPVGPSLGTIFNVSFARNGGETIVELGVGNGSAFHVSRDNGTTWEELESQPFVFVHRIAASGGELYAARFDGLWRRPLASVSAPGGGAPRSVRFAVAGAQPAGDDVRFRIELPAGGPVAIEVFDVSGRRAGDAICGAWPAGVHAIEWNARALAPGVYHARLSTNRGSAIVRLVRAN